MKRSLVIACSIVLAFAFLGTSIAAPPKGVKAKFYDFSDQLIDGEIRRPTALYTDTRQAAKFQRLLRLKRHFSKDVLLRTAKDPVFK
tara:strand:- start:3788 stop:4048 length:261 start_codon:yes stop_codon:yes gene_type:complete